MPNDLAPCRGLVFKGTEFRLILTTAKGVHCIDPRNITNCTGSWPYTNTSVANFTTNYWPGVVHMSERNAIPDGVCFAW